MDYPSLGFSSDKITVGVNLFSIANNTFTGATIYSFDKAGFLNPTGTMAVQRFVMPNMGFTHVPTVTLDPGVADHYVATTWSGNAGGKGFLMILLLSGSVANGTATLNKVGFVTSPQNWDSNPPVSDFAPQMGTAAKVSAGDDRMQCVVLRGGVLYCCHTAFLPQGGNPTHSAVLCWDAPVASWAAATAILGGPGGEFCAHPSLAVNSRGDRLVGHSVFSSATHPSGGYHFIPAGGSPVGPTIFAAGTDTYEKRFGGPSNRWGDYSATMTSPNGDDFWTAQEQSEVPDATWSEPVAGSLRSSTSAHRLHQLSPRRTRTTFRAEAGEGREAIECDDSLSNMVLRRCCLRSGAALLACPTPGSRVASALVRMAATICSRRYSRRPQLRSDWRSASRPSCSVGPVGGLPAQADLNELATCGGRRGKLFDQRAALHLIPRGERKIKAPAARLTAPRAPPPSPRWSRTRHKPAAPSSRCASSAPPASTHPCPWRP
jgi:hypothetical protein